MTKKLNTIVFFGSGPVAETSLRLLAKSYEIECVITKASTKSMMEAAVPKTTVYTVNNKVELDNLINNNNFNSNLGVLIDFGIIVSKQVIDSFEFGIINSHFSLLPDWRGADPITFSILSGQRKTGVSLMLLTPGMDEGPILAQAEYRLSGKEYVEELTQDLIRISNQLMVEVVPKYLKGSLVAVAQEEIAQQLGRPTEPTYSRKLTKADGDIDWEKPAEIIEREIRAFRAWPKSKCTINNIELIITEVEINNELNGKPGEYLVKDKKLFVYCGSNSLSINKLKPAGKKEMPISAFLAGYKI